MKSLLFTCAALFCTNSAFPQSTGEKFLRRAPGTTMRTPVSIDLETGVINRGPRVLQKSASPTNTVITVNNLNFSGFFGISTGPSTNGQFSEWFSSIDKGVGRSGGGSTYLDFFTLAYCSLALDVLSGGPGGAFTLSFWDGFLPGVGQTTGTLGTNLVSISFAGLPAHTKHASFNTATMTPCPFHLLDVGLGGGAMPIVLTDSNIGVSFRFDDFENQNVLAATGPFLSCIASCSGAIGATDGQGMIDRIDSYYAGNFTGSFSFRTSASQPSFASISIQIKELCAIDASDSVMHNNGTGINTQTISVIDAPDLGGTFARYADCTGFSPGQAILRLAFISGMPTLLGGSKGELLVALGAGAGINFLVPHSSGIANLPIGQVPLDLDYFGFVLRAQAFCGTGGNPPPNGATNLTEMVTTTVGSQE